MLNIKVFSASLPRLFSLGCPCSIAKTLWRPNLYTANANKKRFRRIETKCCSAVSRRNLESVVLLPCVQGEQIFGCVDIEGGALHRDSHHPIGIALQQHSRADVTAQLGELFEA